MNNKKDASNIPEVHFKKFNSEASRFISLLIMVLIIVHLTSLNLKGTRIFYYYAYSQKEFFHDKNAVKRRNIVIRYKAICLSCSNNRVFKMD